MTGPREADVDTHNKLGHKKPGPEVVTLALPTGQLDYFVLNRGPHSTGSLAVLAGVLIEIYIFNYNFTGRQVEQL